METGRQCRLLFIHVHLVDTSFLANGTIFIYFFILQASQYFCNVSIIVHPDSTSRLHFVFTEGSSLFVNVPFMDLRINVLFVRSDNEFSRDIYSLFRGRQNIFLTLFRTKFVIKCAIKILKIG